MTRDEAVFRRLSSPRSPLPRETEATAPLGPAFGETLDADLRELGIVLTVGQRAAIDAHARLLLAWNEHINLTTIRTPAQVAREHVADSLTALHLVPAGSSVLDLGSGGGYPGLPLAVAAGVSTLALVDSIGKKARFLEVAATAAGAALTAAGVTAPAVTVVDRRAEALAARPDHRERWDTVTARAVGSLAELVELAFPLLRVGGRLIAWKRDPGLEVEARAARRALRVLGSDPRAIEIHRVVLAGLADHRLVVVHKTATTPDRFPRTVAERRRSALG